MDNRTPLQTPSPTRDRDPDNSSSPAERLATPKPLAGDTIDVFFTGPERQELGVPYIIPVSVTAAADPQVPSAWAALIKNMPFQMDVKGHHLKSKLIERSLSMESLREPILRYGSRNKWSTSVLFNKISKSLANIEATLMQTVGTIQSRENECVHCKEEAGPFSNCVKVEGVEFCANCHWEKLDLRCSFNSQSSTPKRRRTLPHPTDEEIQNKKDLIDSVRTKRYLFEKELEGHRVEHRSLWQEFQGAEDGNVDQGSVSISFMCDFRMKLQKMEEDFNKLMANSKAILDASEELWTARG
ncbi:hypothetical protein N7474_002519 [Penicillium riverlandense]|uniref:uncharacterized protein n=1 Tax=Penicillium riverlandense TaxID=1903569 RepID=UPI002548FD1E|nr:uncharacterized protein N7474_002519 [Penicillium riverlandense]KAJ5825381.1 hypothetical protein N7474_002519 [Penicillium riverlandense]